MNRGREKSWGIKVMAGSKTNSRFSRRTSTTRRLQSRIVRQKVGFSCVAKEMPNLFSFQSSRDTTTDLNGCFSMCAVSYWSRPGRSSMWRGLRRKKRWNVNQRYRSLSTSITVDQEDRSIEEQFIEISVTDTEDDQEKQSTSDTGFLQSSSMYAHSRVKTFDENQRWQPTNNSNRWHDKISETFTKKTFQWCSN